MTFILNRTDDWVTMPKKRILARAVVWYFVFLLVNFVIIVGVTMIYNSMGVEPNQLTRFAGDYHGFLDRPLYYITMAILIGPIVEETIFKDGTVVQVSDSCIVAGAIARLYRRIPSRLR